MSPNSRRLVTQVSHPVGLLQRGFLSKRRRVFSKVLVIKSLDPDWIQIDIQPKKLDPDPDSIRIRNTGEDVIKGGRHREGR
jgi:hypothetical protein